MTSASKKPTRRDYRDAAGNKLPGVTTVLGQTLGWNKDALIGWANKLGREGKGLEARDKAADKGTETHDAVEAALMHGKDPHEIASAEIAANAARVVAFIRERFRVLHCEIPLIGPGCGGTIDLILEDDDGVIIGDLKTGKGVHDEMAVQLGAYQGLWEIECRRRGAFELRADRGLIIHACAGQPLNPVPVKREQLHAGAGIFMHCLAIYQARHAVAIGRSP